MLMKLSSWDEFNGKDFVYVCSATGQSIVNLIPIFHLGKSRVKAIIILVGDENHSHASEQASTKPAKWLADFALAYLKLDESKIKLLPGNSETFVGQWPKLLETAQEFGLTLVANLTGGTKPMALAIDRTLMAIKEPYLAVTVDKSPALCRLSALLNNTEADHLITKIVEPVPLEVLVLSKEYELAERSGKKEELAFYNNHSELLPVSRTVA